MLQWMCVQAHKTYISVDPCISHIESLTLKMLCNIIQTTYSVLFTCQYPSVCSTYRSHIKYGTFSLSIVNIYTLYTQYINTRSIEIV